MKRPVVIVGGGFSGLAAAVELVTHHIPVLLLEQKPRLGGRAYSFVDATTGDVVDNGQHVLIAGYERTMRFLDRIGTRDRLTVQSQPLLTLYHPQRGFCEFKLPKLPSPLHLVAGILTTNLFSFVVKVRMLRAGLSIRAGRQNSIVDEMTIEQWLDSVGQSAETKSAFWEPLAIAIMNEHIAYASATVFLNALRHAFLAEWKNAALAVPHVGLSELYVHDAIRFIELGGSSVQCNADVVRLLTHDELVSGVELRDGTTIDAAAVILAVPHYRIETLLPRLRRDDAESSGMHAVSSVPIVSIHLWFEEDFMAHEVIGLIDRRVQWLFNKRRINREAGTGGHLSCVISGARDFVDLSNDDLVSIALDDVRSVYAQTPTTPAHALVIREKRATFSCSPQSEKLRPDHHTFYSNVYLAGDWTNTGLPATIEGAIISGERCAARALRHSKSPSSRVS